MVAHVAVNVTDWDAAKRFYEAILGPLGYRVVYEEEGAVAYYADERALDFGVARRAPVGGAHVAFGVPDREGVDRFYETALTPAICDVIRKLSGIWKMHFPGKLVRYLDVPQNFDRSMGGRFWRKELEGISAELAERGARPSDPEALRRSIALYNEHRAAVQGLYALRAQRPWIVPTGELYLILRAGFVLPPEEHLEMMRAYRAGAEADASRRPMDQARVVGTGSFCEQPPLGLIKTLERSACYIVHDDFVQVHRFIRGDIATEGDPLDNLVTAFLEQAISSPTRYAPCGEKGADLVAQVRESGAEGVLFCAPSFCDPALLDQPMAVKAVEAAGIPT